MIINKYYDDGSKLVELKPGDYVAVEASKFKSCTAGN